MRVIFYEPVALVYGCYKISKKQIKAVRRIANRYNLKVREDK
jgi:hypothetical protein